MPAVRITSDHFLYSRRETRRTLDIGVEAGRAGCHLRRVAEIEVHLAAKNGREHLRRAFQGNVDDVDAGAKPEQLGRKLADIADAAGAVVELTGMGCGVGDKLRRTEFAGKSGWTASTSTFCDSRATGTNDVAG